MSARPPPKRPTPKPEPPPPSYSGSGEPSLARPVSGAPHVRRRLDGRRITLCVTGSVAAYKAVLLLRLLQKEGAEVEVVLSRAAGEFVGAQTFAGLNGKPPHTSLFPSDHGGELHVELARRTDLLLIVPATADVLARLAAGRADDLVTALALCATGPTLVAPAMHPSMWSHPATQRNVELLRQDQRVGFVGPVSGETASGDVGLGRMAEPEVILGFVIAQLSSPTLRGRHLVVTAGPTAEDIDPVRALTNRSSGKMGFAIAERAAAHGARVTLIAGPVALATPAGVERSDVRSALAMRAALWQALKPDLTGADALVMTAAVADYRPREAATAKLKRSSEPLSLELVPNPDLLAEVGEQRKSRFPLLVGFALETDSEERLIARAREKLIKKKIDLVVANHADESLGLDHIRALLVGVRDCQILDSMPKSDAADAILEWVAARLAELAR